MDPSRSTYKVAVFQCPDPHALGGGDPLHPVGVRFAAHGDQNYFDKAEFYLGGCLYLVGCTAIFAEGCDYLLPGGTGLPGGNTRDSCRPGSKHGDGTLAWYGKDNTPANVLASTLSALRISQGYVDDGDCTHDQYTKSDPNRPTCGRDNTAVTITGLL